MISNFVQNNKPFDLSGDTHMKLYLSLILCVLFCVGLGRSQNNTNPMESSYRTHVNSRYACPGLVNDTYGLICGYYWPNSSYYQTYYEWTLPNGIIPSGYQLSQATLEFSVTEDQGLGEFTFNLGAVSKDLTWYNTNNLWDHLFDFLGYV